MHPNIGLLDEQREAAVVTLNTLLADEYLLYTKTRNYHRNVVGPQFNDLHKFFEAQYHSTLAMEASTGCTFGKDGEALSGN